MIRRFIRLSALAAILMGATIVEAASDSNKVLMDDFDGSDFSATGGLYYKKNFEQSAGTVEFQTAVTHGGTGALKLTIKPICHVQEDGCSERAEIWERPELRVPYNVGVWYGFAVKFGDPIPSDDKRYLIAQWKREIVPGAPGDFSPFLAFRLKKGKLFVTVETDLHHAVPRTVSTGLTNCALPKVPVWLRPETNQMRALIATSAGWEPGDGSLFDACTSSISVINRGNDLPSPDSGWIDFAVYSKPGPDGSGHIEIFANGKWIVTIRGTIGHEDDKQLGKNQYFKFGPYRSPNSTAWTMYYDDFRRSAHCSDVLKGAPCPF